MHDEDQPEPELTALEELQQILLLAGLGLFICLSTGLVAGLLYSPMP